MPDGATKIEHLRAISGRVSVPELDYPEPHEDAIYLLNHFYSVKRSAGVKIEYTELKHYSDLLALDLQPFEVEVIIRIDNIFEVSVNA